jgi:ribosomal 50S subunit-recycling heat shock protein
MSQGSAEVWDEIARQYQAGMAVSVIAKTFDVSRVRIRLQAERFGWTRGAGEGGEAVAPEGTCGSALEASTPAAHPVADTRRMVFERHRAAWASVHDLGDEAFRILRGEEPHILKGLQRDSVEERIDCAAKVITLFEKRAKALMMAQEGERRAHGLDYKQQQEVQTEDEAEIRRRRELTASIVELVSQLRQRTEPSSVNEHS